MEDCIFVTMSTFIKKSKVMRTCYSMKPLLLFLFFLCCMGLFTTSLHAQGWVSILENAETRQGHRVIAMNDGGYVVLDSINKHLVKADALGNELWDKKLDSPSVLWPRDQLILTNDGGIAILFFSLGSFYLYKMDADGNDEWIKEINIANPPMDIRNLAQDNQGNFYLAGDYPPEQNLIIKTDPLGNVLWETSIDGLIWGAEQLKGIIVNSEGDLIVNGTHPPFHAKLAAADGALIWLKERNESSNWDLTRQRISATNDGGAIIISESNSLTRIDVNGDIVWQKPYSGLNVIYSPNNEIAMISKIPIGDQNGIRLTILDENGELLEMQEFSFFTNNMDPARCIAATLDGGYIITGTVLTEPNQPTILLVKTDSDGVLYPNEIEGNIFHDENENCSSEMTELSLEGWLVKFEGDQTFYAVSNEDGEYNLQIDNGNYTPILLPPNNLWETCIQNEIEVSGTNNIYNNDFPVQGIIDCPGMSVDVGSLFLRACDPNYFSIEYCNNGTLPAENASIEFTIDSLLTLDSATVNFVDLGNQTYSFPLGTVPIFECGQFYVYTTLSCDAVLGQTHCVTAHAFPDDLCQLPPDWSGASIALFGECVEDDSIHFEIRNIGTGTMSGQLDYLVIEDDMILIHEPFDPLLPNGVFSIPIDADGSTYRLETEQEPNHPGQSMPSIFIEGCDGLTGLGFANWYADDDEDPYVSILCLENIGSYDPNDKMAFPRGHGVEHYIEANTALEYKIRFQNTGTDTAFYVQIQDLLSPTLDPATIRPGASSHPYIWTIDNTPSGYLLKFTFENIELPQEAINELGSQGFVNFQIQQQVDNPIGTVIENSAGIYFDQNEPVITNTVFHTIGEDFIDLLNFTPFTPTKELQLKVYPNPMSTEAQIVLEYFSDKNIQLKLYNNLGQAIQTLDFDSNQITLKRGQLPAGVYHFSIVENDQLLGTGNLVIQ